MKKLLTICLALCLAPAVFAGAAEELEKMLKEKAEAAYSANAINSALEVSFSVKTIFSISDILEKNGNHLSHGYKIPGNSKEGTNWNLDEIEDMQEIILLEENDDFGPTVFVNEDWKDKNGNFHEVIRTYKTQPKGCSMFLIDENWLIGSRECIGAETEGAVGYPNYILANTPYEINDHIVEGDLYFANDSENKITSEGHIFKGPNVVLVYIEGTDAKKMMSGKPKANVVFFKENIFSMLADGSVANKFQIRTSRFGTGAIRNRGLKPGSYDNGVFSLDDNMINLSGTGGDPLFYTDEMGAQYLVGFNAGRITPTVADTAHYWLSYYKGEVINRFYDFHKEDYDFVKKTISSKSAADWARIKNHLFVK